MSGCSASPAPRPKRAWLGWVVLLGALAGLVIFAATFGHKRQGEEMRHLLFANSARPAAELSACLMRRLPLEGRWLPGAGLPGSGSPGMGQGMPGSGQIARIGAWNAKRDLMVEVLEGGAKGRRVEMSTRGGRALSAGEADALRACLAGE